MIGIWASRRHFPAISKFQHISYHRLTARSEVIVSIAIIVSTKATDMSLKAGTKFDEYTGFLVPHEYQTNSSVNDHVDAHGTDLKWHFSSR